MPPVFYYLLVIGWFILFGRSFYFFRKLSWQFTDYLVKERTIGETTFTIQSVLRVFPDPYLVGHNFQHCYIFASGDQGVASESWKKEQALAAGFC